MKNIERLAHKKLEEILLDSGTVDRGKLEECLRKSRATGQPLEDILIHAEALTEDSLAELLANRLQLPYLSLENYDIPKELLERIPKTLMAKHKFLPIDQFDEVLSIMIGCVPSYEMLEEIHVVTQSDLFVYVGRLSEIGKTLETHQPSAAEVEIGATTATPRGAELTTGWESIFDIADQNVQKDLKKKGEDAGTFDSGEESEYEDLVSGGEAPKSLEDQISQAFGEEIATAPKSESLEDELGRAFGENPGPADTGEPAIEEEEEEIASTAPKNETPPAGEDLKAQIAELTAHLSKNPFDYDAINQYVELSLELGDNKSAVRQLTLFAWGLDQAGKEEEAVNCYEYILELDPNNREAKKRLDR